MKGWHASKRTKQQIANSGNFGSNQCFNEVVQKRWIFSLHDILSACQEHIPGLRVDVTRLPPYITADPIPH